MDILAAARKRHTAKAYDSTRRVPEELMQQVYSLLRHSPSSVNSQPWHFIVANTPEGKALAAAFANAYNNLVVAMRDYRPQEVKGGLGKGGKLKTGN